MEQETKTVMNDFEMPDRAFLSFVYERVEAGKIIITYLFTGLSFVIVAIFLPPATKENICRHQRRQLGFV